MRDTVVEHWLDKRGVRYDYVEAVDLKDVEVDDAAVQNIRLGQSLNEESVIQYALAMDEGAEFPALVLVRQGKKFGVINGMHRIKACEITHPLKVKMDAYVVQTDDKVVIETLRRTVNTLEGQPLSPEELVEQGLRLVDLGHTVRDAARLVCVRPNRIQDRVLERRVRDRLRHLGVEHASLGRAHMTSLHAIARDTQLKAAAQLALEARLTALEMAQLSKEIREARSDEAAMAVITRWRGERRGVIETAMGGMVRAPGTPFRRLPAKLREMEKLIDSEAGKGVATLTATELDAYIEAVKKALADLGRLLETLRRARRKVKAA